MRLKIAFDKARGLKPAEAEDFVATYDFRGNGDQKNMLIRKMKMMNNGQRKFTK